MWVDDEVNLRPSVLSIKQNNDCLLFNSFSQWSLKK